MFSMLPRRVVYFITSFFLKNHGLRKGFMLEAHLVESPAPSRASYKARSGWPRPWPRRSWKLPRRVILSPLWAVLKPAFSKGFFPHAHSKFPLLLLVLLSPALLLHSEKFSSVDGIPLETEWTQGISLSLPHSAYVMITVIGWLFNGNILNQVLVCCSEPGQQMLMVSKY